MAQRRSQAGMFPGAYGGFSRIGEQEMYDPVWTNIDFADFQGLNMNLINQNAQFAQEIANKRLDEFKAAQSKMLDEIKLHKRFDYVQKDLENKLASVIENAGNVQLSDNANFTKLNTNLVSLKHDPELKKVIYSSEQAKKMQELIEKDPNLKDRPWDAPSLNQYNAFLNGQTNEFELTPTYKDVDMVGVFDEFFKELPKNEQSIFAKHGPYGIYTAKEEGYDMNSLINKVERFKQQIRLNNPEIKSHLSRRAKYLSPDNPLEYEEKYLNDAMTTSASKYAQVNRTVSSLEMDPNASGNFQQQQLNISAMNARNSAQGDSSQSPTNLSLKGGLIYKNDSVANDKIQSLFNRQLSATFIPTDQITITTRKGTKVNKEIHTIDPNLSVLIPQGDGSFKIKVTTKPTETDEPPITQTMPISNEIVQRVFNNLSGGQYTPPVSGKGELD